MKRKITFDITVNSYWEHPGQVPEHMRDVEFPQGGEPRSVTVEFDTDNVKPFDDACKALRDAMKDDGDQEYHIWYWDWIN